MTHKCKYLPSLKKTIICQECGKTIEQLISDLEAANKRIADLWAALGVLLDSVDYTSGACKLNEAVGAVLPIEIIEKAKAALKATDD